MFDEIVKTVRLHLSERLTSPLLGAFIISWGAWNYRFLLIILSSEPVERKFELIDQLAFLDLNHAIIRGIALPFLTSLAYLFIYPYPAKFVYAFTRRQQRAILEIRRQIEEETPLTIQDSRKIRTDLARAELEYFAELERKDREIERLRSQLIPASTDPEPESSPGNDGKSEPENSPLGDELVTMLLKIEKLSGEAPEQALISSSGMSKTEAEYNLGELVRLGLARRNYKPSRSAYVYTFTHSGRAALLTAKRQAANV